MSSPEPSPPAAESDAATIAALRAEVARLKAALAQVSDELRRSRRDQHETPPHYL